MHAYKNVKISIFRNFSIRRLPHQDFSFLVSLKYTNCFLVNHDRLLLVYVEWYHSTSSTRRTRIAYPVAMVTNMVCE